MTMTNRIAAGFSSVGAAMKSVRADIATLMGRTDDTGWVDLSEYVEAGFTADEFVARRVGSQVNMTISFTGETPDGRGTRIAIIPYGWRPARNVAGGAVSYVSTVNGRAGGASLGATGSLTLYNSSGASRSSWRASFSYSV